MLIRIIISSTILLLSSQILQAETYVREYTYHASEADSKLTSRIIALDQIKTLLLQEIGTHIRQKIEITKDGKGNTYASENVEAISAGLTKVEVLEEKWNGEVYYVKARINADTDKVLNALYEFKKSNDEQLQLIKDSLKIREQVRHEIKLLNEKLKANNRQDEIISEYTTDVNKLATNQIFENAWNLDTQKQYNAAATLYEKSAKQGHIVSQTRLGFMYMIGKGVIQNDTLAEKWIKQAVFKEYPLAMKYLGDLYAGGIGVLYNQTTAVYWYKKAARKGNLEAMHELHFYYSTGVGSQSERNPDLATYWLNEANKTKSKKH